MWECFGMPVKAAGSLSEYESARSQIYRLHAKHDGYE